MLAISYLSPSRYCPGKGQARLVRGPRDFSRGIRTQFSRTEGSGSSRQRVAVSSLGCLCCPEIFEDRLTFLSAGRSPPKKSRLGHLFGSPEEASGLSVRAEPGAVTRPAETDAAGGRRQGGVYMAHLDGFGKFFRPLKIEFVMLSTGCGQQRRKSCPNPAFQAALPTHRQLGPRRCP